MNVAPDKDLFEVEHDSFRVALCQVETEPWDVEGNLDRTLRALDDAGAAGAHLAITPEGVFHGYGYTNSPKARGLLQGAAETVDGPSMSRVRDAARKYGMDLVVGFAERGEGDAVHNSAAFIDGAGEIVNVYRKIHLRPGEDVTREGGYTAGDTFVVAERAYEGVSVRVGTLICFDRELPEPTRCLRAMGAQFIACPLACRTFDMNEARTRADNEMITMCRAAENEVFMAVVNHAKRFTGRSFVVGPRGELVHQMGTAGGVDVVEAPVGLVDATYHTNPLGWKGWGHRRPDLYATPMAQEG